MTLRSECPQCGREARYDGRVLLDGRGIYRCDCGIAFQDLDEKPETAGVLVLRKGAGSPSGPTATTIGEPE